MEDLDKFDLQILDILQKDNQTSQRDIGDRIGLSAAAVQRRIKRMRENKIITSDISVIDPEKSRSTNSFVCRNRTGYR
ncbi:Lrp/AsnC family transcriptional regulator [Elizabethkingia anophelis]|uniref:Lrp/AsnC family transcriptional regulator n=1 Tax=Elizabethkingia anophelis TaxID=1117645 RepID=UPI0038927D91